MDTEEKDGAELETVPEFKEEEVRAKLVEELGLDEVDDAERIDKLLTRERESHKKLSTAIGQKVKWRTEATKSKDAPALASTDSKIAPEDIDKRLDARLAQRDLDEMDVSDDLRKEIGEWAQFKGITVKQAARDPIFVSKIDAYKAEKRKEEATISRTNRSTSRKSYSLDEPPQVDMTTEEGRKEWEDYKKWARSQES